MRGKKRRDEGWDEGRRDWQEDPRDTWPGDEDYQDAPPPRPAAGYARNGIGYAGQDSYGQDGYGRQAPGAAQRPAAGGYAPRGYEPNGYRGPGPEPGAAGYQEPGYGGAGYDPAGYPGGEYAGGGYGARGQGGYGRAAGYADPGYGDQLRRGAAQPGYGAYGTQVRRPPSPAGPKFVPADDAPSDNESEPGTRRPYGRLCIFTLLDDKAAEFDRLAERAAEGVRAAEPDTLVYVIHVVPKAPMQRIIYEVYRDRAAFESHERQPHIQRFIADRRSCVLATNVVDLRLKYAKVAALGSPSAPPAPAQAPAPDMPAPAGRAAPGGQRQGGGAGPQYPATGMYDPALDPQHQAQDRHAAGPGGSSSGPAAGQYRPEGNGRYPANGQSPAGGQYPPPGGGPQASRRPPELGSGRQLESGREAPSPRAGDRDSSAHRAGRYGAS